MPCLCQCSAEADVPSTSSINILQINLKEHSKKPMPVGHAKSNLSLQLRGVWVNVLLSAKVSNHLTQCLKQPSRSQSNRPLFKYPSSTWKVKIIISAQPMRTHPEKMPIHVGSLSTVGVYQCSGLTFWSSVYISVIAVLDTGIVVTLVCTHDISLL